MKGNIEVRSEPGKGSCFRFNVLLHRVGNKTLKHNTATSLLRRGVWGLQKNDGNVEVKTVKTLKDLPQGIRTGLKQTLEEGDTLQFQKILAQFPVAYFKIATQLNRLIETFEYTKIKALLEEGAESDEGKPTIDGYAGG